MNALRYSTVSSGIEACTAAWHPLGWKPVWFSEIADFPNKVLKHHYPDVPNLGDMLKLLENETFNESTFDLLCGGTPCQSFSIAGLRAGLSDDRGNLALQFCRLLIAKRPRWFVWENVPGVLTSYSDVADCDAGTVQTADFATLLNAFHECGYSCAWRVLDAQYFGVPQRRRRVFVVGYLGDWRPPSAVLFDGESGSGDFTPSGGTRKDIAGTLTSRTTGGGYPGTDEAVSGHVVPMVMATGQPKAEITTDLCSTLSCNHEQPILFTPYPIQQMTSPENRSNPRPGDPSPTLTASSTRVVIVGNQYEAVRRLTPIECERLQGFPDDYTNVPGASDTTRYKALGNSMAVPVMEWIGRRIQLIDDYLQHNQLP
jgi:DNA (cytosine-5)-methyltransferase 1